MRRLLFCSLMLNITFVSWGFLQVSTWMLNVLEFQRNNEWKRNVYLDTKCACAYISQIFFFLSLFFFVWQKRNEC
jgi:hypothetical protein